MIEKCNAFKIGDRVFESITDAQEHAIEELLKNVTDQTGIASVIVASADKVVDILTTTPKSKPRARKINKRKPQETPVT